MKKHNIAVYLGSAKITTKDSVIVTDSEGKFTELKANNIVIASGATTMVPPAWKVDGKKILTYLEAILQPVLPKSTIIIGAGAIGVEFATIWNSYGVPVTIVEMLPRLVPQEDEEVSAELSKALAKRKINILVGHRVESLEATEAGVTLKASGDKGEVTLQAEQALVAIGFRPNSQDLGLEQLGVKLNDRGAIEIDDRMATNVPGFWAIGDVTAKLMLAHVGSAQGIVCAENMQVGNNSANYEMMPAHALSATDCIFWYIREPGKRTWFGYKNR
jgi:dihydrolipoamide dehydrogenase